MFEKYWKENGLKLPSHMGAIEASYKEVAEKAWNAARANVETFFISHDRLMALRGVIEYGGYITGAVIACKGRDEGRIGETFSSWAQEYFSLSNQQEIEETFGIKL